MLPILYKKTSTGKIQQWEIFTENKTYWTVSGQVDGKKITSEPTTCKGKNKGKANETSSEEQAIKEAKSKWEGKKKSGYIETIEDAKDEIVSDLVEGGFTPMLAETFDKDSDHISFPCAVQPKLDGSRGCYSDGALWSRTRKTIVSVPHITAALKDLSFDKLDGELYNHKYKDDFETIMHIVRQQKEPAENYKLCQYHVYDVPSDKPFSERLIDLKKLAKSIDSNGPIKIVETAICNNLGELKAFTKQCIEKGYEGAMARNLEVGYEYKRSKNLQKIKEFEDKEFEIVGVEEGKGKLEGHCSAFICITEEGNTFKAKMVGKIADLKKYLENKEDYIGKQLTVQFQGLTNKSNVPRFPIALRIRE